MPRKNADEFKGPVKNKTAFRAGYRCCFRGCNKVLISKADNEKGYTNDAEYCHIEAAAPNGPRYNANMSSDERSGFDNCIIMCRNHAKAIDSEPNKYTVEILKEMKNEAEERTYKERIGNQSFDEPFKMEAAFDSLIVSGEFETLNFYLNNYISNSIYLDEIVLRFKIKLDYFFGVNNLDNLYSYLKCGYDKIDEIAVFYVEHNYKEGLRKILARIKDDNVRDLASCIVDKELSEIITDKDFFKKVNLIDKNLQLKIIMNYLIACDDYHCYILDEKGNPIDFYIDEFYYEVIAFIMKLKRSFMLDRENLTDRILIKLSEYIKFIDKIYLKFKINAYRSILIYLIDQHRELFEDYYNRLNNEEKNQHEIKKLYYDYKLQSDFSSVTIDELLNFADSINDYNMILKYLAYNPSIGKEFINDHMYLLKKEPGFLIFYMTVVDDEIFKNEVLKYKDYYNDNFTYNCILWKTFNDSKCKEYCITNEDKITNINIELYLYNLIESKEYDRCFNILEKVSEPKLVAHALFKMNDELSHNRSYDEKFISLYNKTYEREKIKGIKHNLAIIYYEQDKIHEALECIYEEITEFKNYESLKFLIRIRMEQNDYTMDDYFKIAQNYNDFIDLYYVAEVYLNNNDKENALIYYEKALITGEQNTPSLYKIYELTHSKEKKDIDIVKDNTAVLISNGKDKIILLFHKKNIIDGLVSGNNKWIDACLDYSTYADFGYCSKGDKINYKNENYVVEIIEDIYTFYEKEALQIIMNHPSAKPIYGPPENAIEEIKKLLLERREYVKNLIGKYKEIKNKVPLSMSSKYFFDGKVLDNIDYLLVESSDKLFNNNILLTGDFNKVKIILYFDDFYILFKLYEKYPFNKMPDNFYTTQEIQKVLLNEINSSLSKLDENNESLYMNDSGQMILRKDDIKYRKDSRSHFIKFRSFVESIKTIKSFDYDIFLEGKKLNAKNIKIEEERSVLSICSKDCNAIVLTDDCFMTTLCIATKMPFVGVTSILKYIYKNSDLIEVAKMLKKLNFNNYFTYDMYIGIDINETYQDLYDFVNMEFENSNDSLKHYYIMSGLLRELYEKKKLSLFNDSVLLDYLIRKNEEKKKQG